MIWRLFFINNMPFHQKLESTTTIGLKKSMDVASNQLLELRDGACVEVAEKRMQSITQDNFSS